MKVLVLGDGLLGRELVKQTGWNYLSRKRDGFDLTDVSTFSLLLDKCDGKTEKAKYSTVVNCIANTNTYSQDRQAHWDTNYKGVADLVDFCNKQNIKLVHISTDYIYANSTGIPTENDIPVHQETYYAYTKLLADGYVELRSNNFLIVRATHKRTPFIHKEAWINQIGNFDYVDNIAQSIIKLVNNQAIGIFNVGTELKSMHQLAQQTNPKVVPIICPEQVPTNTQMDLTKFNNL
jgi:nucleoside-diphosphate-sugar epimerase